MARFLTIGYGSEDGYRATDERVRAAAHEHDSWLISRGAIIGIAGTPAHVWNHGDAGLHSAEGPFMRADLPVAGFALIDAKNIEEAIQLAAKTPCAVAQGVVEVWPLEQQSAD